MSDPWGPTFTEYVQGEIVRFTKLLIDETAKTHRGGKDVADITSQNALLDILRVTVKRYEAGEDTKP